MKNCKQSFKFSENLLIDILHETWNDFRCHGKRSSANAQKCIVVHSDHTCSLAVISLFNPPSLRTFFGFTPQLVGQKSS